jgi:hypothetical protein
MATSNDHRKVTKRSSNAYVAHHYALCSVTEIRLSLLDVHDAADKRSNVLVSNHVQIAENGT